MRWLCLALPTLGPSGLESGTQRPVVGQFNGLVFKSNRDEILHVWTTTPTYFKTEALGGIGPTLESSRPNLVPCRVSEVAFKQLHDASEPPNQVGLLLLQRLEFSLNVWVAHAPPLAVARDSLGGHLTLNVKDFSKAGRFVFFKDVRHDTPMGGPLYIDVGR